MSGDMLDLSDVVTLLEAAAEHARRLHNTPGVFDPDTRENRHAAAQQSRELQVVEHLAQRAAAEVRAIFWELKGFPDPLAG